MSSSTADVRRKTQAGQPANHQKQLALYRKWRAGGIGCRTAYDELVASFRKMVWGVVHKNAALYGVDATADLFQDGHQAGVIPALESYDPAGDARISTYVFRRVRWAIRDHARRYRRWRRELLPSAGEGCKEQAVDQRILAEEQEAVAKQREALRRALRNLTPLERKVMRMKLGQTADGRVWKDWEIAKRLRPQKSRSRISQIAHAAKRKLKENRRLARDLGFYSETIYT